MNNENKTSELFEKEIDINVFEIVKVLWGYRFLISVVTLLSFSLSVIYVRTMPNIYLSEVHLAPVSQTQAPALGEQLGGLASMVGINLSSLDSTDKTAEGLSVLSSRKFVSDFITRRNILPQLMAVKAWDSINDALIFDTEMYDPNQSKWLTKPSTHLAYMEFVGRIWIAQDPKTRFITVSFKHVSPYMAQQWVEWLVEDINNYFRNQAVSEAELSLIYLNGQLETTALSEMQKMFYQLIGQQTKIIMLANGRSEYLFRTLDPAVVPQFKSEPQRTTIVILAGLVAAFLSIMFLLIVHYSNYKLLVTLRPLQIKMDKRQNFN